jgi:lysyl-tRNA synthetase class 1
MASLKLATALFDRFPDLRIAVIRVSLPAELPAGAGPAARALLIEAQGDPAEVDFSAWHEAFRWFGSKPKKYRCAAEALLLRVRGGHAIPSILPLVDLYNAWSIRSGLPIGGDDLARVQGDIQLTFATGDEVFTEASGAESSPRKGEVIYRDRATVLCRRWNWREAAATLLSEATTEAILYVEAPFGETNFEATIQGLADSLRDVLHASRAEVVVLSKAASALDLDSLQTSLSDRVGEPPSEPAKQRPQQVRAPRDPGTGRSERGGRKRRDKSEDPKGFWADVMAGEILEHIERHQAVLGPIVERQGILVYDEKTPSGQIHVGSSRGWILHDVIARALREKGAPGYFVLSSDDMDPYDKPSVGLDRTQWDQHLGKPFRHMPSPAPGYDNYGDYYFRSCTELFDLYGIECSLESTGALYEEGAFDAAIRTALDKADVIQAIYAQMYPDAVSGGATRLPFNPLCEQCGRIGTTRGTGWDGGRGLITYECRSDILGYTDPESKQKVFIEGCGHRGERSPFGGGGKFPWKVEWAAKWITKGVIAEWAGKDHFSAGGSRAAACRISVDVFGYPPPYPSNGHRTGAGYEFLVVGGRKMSTSKGSGVGFADVTEVISPRMLRFLMIRSKPNQVIDFDPNRDVDIVNLYNKHDSVERAAWGLEDKQPEAVVQRFDRMHFYTYPDRGDHRSSPLPVRPSFRVAALVGQANETEEGAVAALRAMGHLPPGRGDAEVTLRIEEAKRWLEAYAPQSTLRIELRDSLDGALEIGQDEAGVFGTLATLLRAHLDGSAAQTEDSFKTAMFSALRSADLDPRAFFGLAYRVLLGRDDGPAMSPFLLSMAARTLPMLDAAAAAGQPDGG